MARANLGTPESGAVGQRLWEPCLPAPCGMVSRTPHRTATPLPGERAAPVGPQPVVKEALGLDQCLCFTKAMGKH